MRRILISIFLFIGLWHTIVAQTSQTPTSKKVTEKQERKHTDTVIKASGTKKDGTPDMRFKQNKEAVKQAPIPQTSVPTTATPNDRANIVAPHTDPSNGTTKTSQTVASSVTKTTDKAVGTDDKGRTIYEGPRGGKYYINKNGNKEYLKK